MRGDVDMVIDFLPPLRAGLGDKKIRAAGLDRSQAIAGDAR